LFAACHLSKIKAVMAEKKKPGRIRLGVSACLLGQPVRYDGKDKLIPAFKKRWSRFVTWVPVCPETECGLTVPREKIGLFGPGPAFRLKGLKTGKDVTGQMVHWTEKKLDELVRANLSGFILKSGSPSCGLTSALDYSSGVLVSGLFTSFLQRRFPDLPLVEEKNLAYSEVRENFLDRIFVYKRWQEFLEKDGSIGGLVSFHARHKLIIMAHSVRLLSLLGNLVASARNKAAVLAQYQKYLTAAMKKPATGKTHTNVLQHLAGYFKKVLPQEERERLAQQIKAYSQGALSREEILSSLRHYARRYRQRYLLQQFYLFPEPEEWPLRFISPGL